MYFKIILLAAVFAVSVYSESFEQYREKRDAEMREYNRKQKKKFHAWQKQQSELLNEMESEREKYIKDMTVEFEIWKREEGVLSSGKTDYREGKIEIKASASAQDSSRAVKKAEKAYRSGMEKSVRKSGGKAFSGIKSEKLMRFVNKNSYRKKLNIKKSYSIYTVVCEGSQDLTGEKGVIKLANPGSKEKRTKEKPGVTPSDYTSLIIDASGLNYSSCLIPVIEDNDGNRVYGPAETSRKHAVNGLVRWVKNIEEARAEEKSGDSPLIVKASSVKERTHLVLGKDAAEKAAGFKDSPLFRECRVIIIVN